MEYIVHDGSKNQIDSNFFHLRMRRLDWLTADIDHALVVCDLRDQDL